MASGTITLKRTGSGYLNGRILWESVSNGTVENTSTVTATLQLQRGAKNTTTGTFKGTFTVGSISESISKFTELPSNTWVTVKTVTTTISHNANGTGSCYLYAKITGPNGTTMEGTSVTGSETVALDTIARFAYLVTAPDFYDEENPVITYCNPAGNSADTLEACISLDGSHAEVSFRDIPKTGTSYTFELTDKQRETLCAATTEGNSRTVRFFIRTRIGEETGKHSLTRTFTIKNPKPTLNPVVVDTNTATTALTGDSSKLIRYYSNAKVTIGAAAVKGAELVSQKVTCGSKSRTTDGNINAVESGTFVFTAKDSRGNTKKKTVNIPIVAYVKLSCNLSYGAPDGEGNMMLRAEGNCFTGSFGAKSNTLQVRYRYKLYSGEYGSWQQMTAVRSGNTYTAQAEVTGLDYRRTYVFQISAQDALSQVTTPEKNVKALPVFDWGEADFRFRVPVNMAGNRITSLASPEAAGDGVNLGYMHGLGLGAGGRMTADMNNEKDTGWYAFSSDCANAPFRHGVAMTIRRAEADIVQLAFNPHTGETGESGEICRRCFSTDWSRWEYLNPPCMLGMEYPTTERYLGKTVYIKLLDFGMLPASQNKNVAYAGTAATPVFVQLMLSDGCVLGAGYGKDRSFLTTSGLYLDVTKYNVRVFTEADFSSLSAYAMVKYTKDAEVIV